VVVKYGKNPVLSHLVSQNICPKAKKQAQKRLQRQREGRIRHLWTILTLQREVNNLFLLFFALRQGIFTLLIGHQEQKDLLNALTG
jgi:hypothetical protein